jgi:HEAT repeat protein
VIDPNGSETSLPNTKHGQGVIDMWHRNAVRLALAAALALGGYAMANAAEKPTVDKAELDQALAALKTYDWGADRSAVKPIEDAVVATHGDAAATKDLEMRLAAVLKTDAPYDAKQYVCRKLMVIGTAESVPALAGLLPDNHLSHMARYALERMPVPEAAQALRDALSKVGNAQKVGVLASLGARRDAASASAVAALLTDADKAVARAAACALGDIGTPEAAKALGEFAKKAPAELKLPVADASLVCAERLLAAGKKAEAMMVYKSLSGEDQPKNIRLAATRGLLSVAQKKD